MQHEERGRVADLYLLSHGLQDDAAASGAFPWKEGLVIDDRDLVFRVFMCEAIIAFARIALNESDPDEVVQDWFDQADEPDQKALSWAMGIWRMMRTMNSFQLERAQQRASKKLEELGGSGELSGYWLDDQFDAYSV